MGSSFYGERIMEEVKIDLIWDINSREYWEGRFSTGDWEQKGGRSQTAHFATSQVPHFRFDKDFSGSLVDFGCGLGDAIPIYNKFFPNAKLLGIDVSESAISKCKERYGKIASFISGTHQNCPPADFIIASNVFEHLADDVEIARTLLGKCKELYITVPYNEYPLCSEHVRSYDKNHFRELGIYEYTIFPSRGWTEYGMSLIKLKVKNILKRIIGRNIRPRRMQIMFYFKSSGVD